MTAPIRTAPIAVLLDACVLVNSALRDTLLRLAEPPQLYRPCWSRQIMDETIRTLETKLGLKPAQTSYLVSELRTHFPEAWIGDYEKLIPAMQNHPKDRHVLASAIRAGAQTIVTFNRRDFPSIATAPWAVQVQSPDDFLTLQYRIAPEIVRRKLQEQAE